MTAEIPAADRQIADDPSASLSPAERVIPTWTDPTVRRAATLIGGPLGTHASVGRNRLITPLRVVLAFAIAALIVGWLAKSPCIQTGANGELDQDGQRPWITGCYNDIVPLYGARGLADPSRMPYAYSWVDNGPDQPAGQVFPLQQVRQDAGQWVVDQGTVAQVVGSGDLIYDGARGYSRVEGDRLVPAEVVGGPAIDDGADEGDGAGGSAAGSSATGAPATGGDGADAAGEDTGERGPVTVRHLEYPVLTGYFMWGAAALTAQYLGVVKSTGLLPVPLDVGAYFTITAILLGLCYLWAVASTAFIARRRIWDVAIMCAAPLLMVQAFTNWDLLAVGLTAAAMAAWARTGGSRRRRAARGPQPVANMRSDPAGAEPDPAGAEPDSGGAEPAPGDSGPAGLAQGAVSGIGWALLAGALLGLGTAAKLYPALLLGPLALLCLRAGRMRHFSAVLLGAVVSWLAVNLPVALNYPQAWSEFFTMNASRGPEWDSVYFLSSVIAPTGSWWSDDQGQATGLLNGLSLALFVLCCLAIGYLALAAPRRPRFAQLAFLVIVAFLLTNKVYSPQYALWLLPLVTLALPRWRPVLAWQLSEVVVWFLLMLSFSTDTGKNVSIHPFAIAAVVRYGLLIMLVVLVVREILRPATDLVRKAGDDDPSGGVLEGAADRFTLTALQWPRGEVGQLDPGSDGSALVEAIGGILGAGPK